MVPAAYWGQLMPAPHCTVVPTANWYPLLTACGALWSPLLVTLTLVTLIKLQSKLMECLLNLVNWPEGFGFLGNNWKTWVNCLMTWWFLFFCLWHESWKWRDTGSKNRGCSWQFVRADDIVGLWKLQPCCLKTLNAPRLLGTTTLHCLFKHNNGGFLEFGRPICKH